jgi:hypothetical protein
LTENLLKTGPANSYLNTKCKLNLQESETFLIGSTMDK